MKQSELFDALYFLHNPVGLRQWGKTYVLASAIIKLAIDTGQIISVMYHHPVHSAADRLYDTVRHRVSELPECIQAGFVFKQNSVSFDIMKMSAALGLRPDDNEAVL